MIFIFAVRGNCENFIALSDSPTCTCPFIIELSVENKQEGYEKLSSIFDFLKVHVLQDGLAGHVPRVKNLTCKYSFAIFGFCGSTVTVKLRKIVERKNLQSYGTAVLVYIAKRMFYYKHVF